MKNQTTQETFVPTGVEWVDAKLAEIRKRRDEAAKAAGIITGGTETSNTKPTTKSNVKGLMETYQAFLNVYTFCAIEVRLPVDEPHSGHPNMDVQVAAKIGSSHTRVSEQGVVTIDNSQSHSHCDVVERTFHYMEKVHEAIGLPKPVQEQEVVAEIVGDKIRILRWAIIDLDGWYTKQQAFEIKTFVLGAKQGNQSKHVQVMSYNSPGMTTVDVEVSQ